MRVYIAGATGALGRHLVPLLVARGHEVVGTTRTAAKADALRALGARPAVVDALDADAVGRAVAEAEPEVLVHQLTALSGEIDMRHIDRAFAATNRLRTEGLDHLLAAGRAAGARRAVVQSFTGWPFARTGGPVKTEADPLDPHPPAALRRTLEAIRYLEATTTGIDWGEGLVLRYGGFYGPGTGISVGEEGNMAAAVRARRFPVVGAGDGVWSLVHIEDAAAATADAVERGARRDLPGRRRRAGAGARVAARPRERHRRAPAAAGAALAGPGAGRRGGDRDDDREPRRLERQGQARAGLAPRLPQLAPGVRRGAPRGVTGGDLYEELRPRAFAVAYRMLGSASEAEDVVQEALLRLHRALAGGERIDSPPAWVAAVVTRLSIDELRSARARRESYVGEWLPEPLVAGEDEPAAQAELADSLSLAFLVVLESLSPEQRAAFLLREVFDYPYDQIAAIVGTSEANARQLTARARRHVEERRPRYEPSQEVRDELARRFLAAAREGDLAGLEELLAEDVVLHGDGGGKVPALARAIHGRERVARTLVAWVTAGRRIGGLSLRPEVVNGQPGAVVVDGEGRPMAVWSLDVADGRIRAVRSVVNPDKLRHLSPRSAPR